MGSFLDGTVVLSTNWLRSHHHWRSRRMLCWLVPSLNVWSFIGENFLGFSLFFFLICYSYLKIWIFILISVILCQILIGVLSIFIHMIISLTWYSTFRTLNSWLWLGFLNPYSWGLFAVICVHRASLIFFKMLLHELKLSLTGNILVIVKTILPFCVLIKGFPLLLV